MEHHHTARRKHPSTLRKGHVCVLDVRKHVTGEHQGESVTVCRYLLDSSLNDLNEMAKLVIRDCGFPLRNVLR